MTPALLLRIFVPFAAGYFLSFLFRVVNAVLAPHLLHDLHLGPSTLGLLTATYFIAFASAQLPLGVLLDRFGPRRVEALLLLIAAVPLTINLLVGLPFRIYWKNIAVMVIPFLYLLAALLKRSEKKPVTQIANASYAPVSPAPQAAPVAQPAAQTESTSKENET